MTVTFVMLVIQTYESNKMLQSTLNENDELTSAVEEIFQKRNSAILSSDVELIETIYDTQTKYGQWAYEYEIRKMKYIHNWSEKQGVKFIEINPKIVVRKIKGSGGKFSVNLLCSTEYKYVYTDQPEKTNSSRIGTYHVLNLVNKDGLWTITKEWYKDPFADSLNLENLKVDSVKQYILSKGPRDLSAIGERRQGAVDYAAQYCGAATEEKYGFKYNKKYRDYNPQGGDCANFASQMLYEGGKFRKTSGWNYDKNGATRGWVNADGFKRYWVNSGRASVIAYGYYEKVYKYSYNLLPGDFVAYEKDGDINHISMVTGADSRGYT